MKLFFKEEDDSKESVEHLVEHRLPWLTLGLLGGILSTFIISKYEAVLNSDLRLAFFIPIIVYLSDAIGTQTETIYVRTLSEKKIHVLKYILKETLIGMCLGVIFGLALGLFAFFWLHSMPLAITIGITMVVNLSLAPVLAVFIPSILYKRKMDPALGSGPLATIIQDLISLLVYFVVASFLIF